ncbi:MAG: hypothetical protein AAF074_21830 [Pseudomonadota bacterium]
MRKTVTLSFLAAAAAAIALVFGLQPVPPAPGAGPLALPGLSASPAAAQTVRGTARRTARRTSRRTSRRQSYIRTLPAGCAFRAPYHYCGGVYYAPKVVDGANVYVVVTP